MEMTKALNFKLLWQNINIVVYPVRFTVKIKHFTISSGNTALYYCYKYPRHCTQIILRVTALGSAAVCLPHWAAFYSKWYYFIDRASGSNRQRSSYFIKTIFSSSTCRGERCQVRPSITTSAERADSLWHNRGRGNNNTNVCLYTLQSYSRPKFLNQLTKK